jgi:predicted CopG family antitoxin
MKLKTVSVDAEAFALLRKEKGPRESYGDVVRRVFTAHREAQHDPSDLLDELFAEFGGKGVLSEEGRTRVLSRRKNPVRSPRQRRAL